jgi:hypothetical protein
MFIMMNGFVFNTNRFNAFQKVEMIRMEIIEEIIESVKEYHNVMVVGCQTCVAVSLTGGDRAARSMTEALTYAFKDSKTLHLFETSMLERQCERDWIDPFFDLPEVLKNWSPGGSGGPRQLIHPGETPF